DLLSKQSIKLFEKWVHRFLYDITWASTKYPLVSGFYRFASAVRVFSSVVLFFQSNSNGDTTIESTETNTNETSK
ncbi:unnamed protein product, partial [Didymodactylos carnosus]